MSFDKIFDLTAGVYFGFYNNISFTIECLVVCVDVKSSFCAHLHIFRWCEPINCSNDVSAIPTPYPCPTRTLSHILLCYILHISSGAEYGKPPEAVGSKREPSSHVLVILWGPHPLTSYQVYDIITPLDLRGKHDGKNKRLRHEPLLAGDDKIGVRTTTM